MSRVIVGKKESGKAAPKPGAVPAARTTSKASRPDDPAATPRTAAALPTAMTGRASPAKAKDGDEPVFAYIRSLPQPQRGIAARIDALAAETLPELKRAVKWAWPGMAWATAGASPVAASPATSSSRSGTAPRSNPCHP